MTHQKATKLYQRLIDKECIALGQDQDNDPAELLKLFDLAQRHYLSLPPRKRHDGQMKTFRHQSKYGNHNQRYRVDDYGRIKLLLSTSGYEYVTLKQPIYAKNKKGTL